MINWIRSRAEKIFYWYQLAAFALFLIVIFVLVNVIGMLDRGLHLDNFRSIVLQAIVFSFMLTGLYRLKSSFRVLVSAIGGIVVSFWVIGDLSQPAVEFVRTALVYVKSAWQYFFGRVEMMPETGNLQESWGALAQAATVLFERLSAWLGALPEPVYDPISLNLIWGFVIWVVSIWVYWYVVKRKQALVGFLPALAISAGVYQSTEMGLYALFWVLGFGLLLELLSHQAKQETSWKQNRLSYSVLIRRRTAQNALAISFALVFFAGTISSPKLEEFIDELKQQRETASDPSGGSVSDTGESNTSSDTGPSEVMGEASFGRFPNTHLVGSGPELSEIEVMYVGINDQSLPGEKRLYLRSSSYNTYTIHGWLTVDKGFVLNNPTGVTAVEHTANERLVHQDVVLLNNKEQGNLMYTVGELVSADVPYFASYHTRFLNDTYVDLFAAVTVETEYSAYSIAPNFGIDELRNSPQEYPDWITNKYLQIPDEVPDRVYELALQLTATQPTPYDRAVAIEQYLRQFEYTLDLEDPPAYHDIADYFLFELQKGYCDYYATSMVVLARAAGLPARFATGYVTGPYDVEREKYVVTADLAHAWPEIYFAGYGWVTFEPTSGRSALDRLEEREDNIEEAADDLDLAADDQGSVTTLFSLLPDNLFVLTTQLSLVIILGILAAHWIDLLVLRAIEPNKMYSRLYRRLRRRAKSLGVKIRLADTPFEFSEVLTGYLTQFESPKLISGVIFSAPKNVKLIITACNLAAYAKEPPNEDKAHQVISVWGRLRWQLFLVRINLWLIPIGYRLRRVWRRLQQPA
jgi:hypothetical protein